MTPATHGNAIGMGMAEFCRTQMLGEVDFEATRLNALTSGRVSAAMPPLDYRNDQAMLAAAFRTIGLRRPADIELMWIADTLHLAEVECSAAYLPQAQQNSRLEILAPPREMTFDAEGNLTAAFGG